MSESLQPGDSPGLLLWRATLGWQRRITAALKPLGLTHVQFVLLTSTWWITRVAGETPSQRRIAEHANTDPMMTSQVLRVLAERELLTRMPDPSDSRAWIIDITPGGADLAVRAVKVVEDADRAFFEVVEDQQALMAVLKALGR
ncbi:MULTISPECIES: MarR family winged helix-turn-helix transcriptional regulator [Burkholderia]|uniref:MarR family winged helix-turn-helix transcriptional regulator n=1 Tax=Burkholderia TaxID=32008 RepID=UPI000F091B2C|nr:MULTISPECIES: MarR family winged helix-turn-helix transcriptional regulator [Burkholderia]AYQ43612.1 MarR family transcriptional regulator [Burkholderia lata]UKD17150.1 MarR family winged helix-turn-helix transcriptional regulator [Burkholderia aenigmatica]